MTMTATNRTQDARRRGGKLSGSCVISRPM